MSGPIFQKIAEAALQHFGVSPTINAPPPVLVAKRTDHDQYQPASNRDIATVVPAGNFSAVHDVPDLRGLSAREALRVLTKIGLSARINGNGLVASQSPEPGSPVDSGGICELWLERAPVPVASIAEP